MWELQLYLTPQAEHILDWFHVTMRVMVLRQLALGVPEKPADSHAGRTTTTPAPEDEAMPPDGEGIAEHLERVKCFVWPGNQLGALDRVGQFGRRRGAAGRSERSLS